MSPVFIIQLLLIVIFEAKGCIYLRNLLGMEEFKANAIKKQSGVTTCHGWNRSFLRYLLPWVPAVHYGYGTKWRAVSSQTSLYYSDTCFNLGQNILSCLQMNSSRHLEAISSLHMMLDACFQWLFPSHQLVILHIRLTSRAAQGLSMVQHINRHASLTTWSAWKKELSQTAPGCVTRHACHASVTHFRPISGNIVEVTLMTSPKHVYNSHAKETYFP